ncbi:MAG: hypothetical protein P4L10_11395 [Acidobacteriaceae bacterium]|nr:hypothetical protein [Acidobacteriaceae bacterium]
MIAIAHSASALTAGLNAAGAGKPAGSENLAVSFGESFALAAQTPAGGSTANGTAVAPTIARKSKTVNADSDANAEPVQTAKLSVPPVASLLTMTTMLEAGNSLVPPALDAQAMIGDVEGAVASSSSVCCNAISEEPKQEGATTSLKNLAALPTFDRTAVRAGFIDKSSQEPTDEVPILVAVKNDSTGANTLPIQGEGEAATQDDATTAQAIPANAIVTTFMQDVATVRKAELDNAAPMQVSAAHEALPEQDTETISTSADSSANRTQANPQDGEASHAGVSVIAPELAKNICSSGVVRGQATRSVIMGKACVADRGKGIAETQHDMYDNVDQDVSAQAVQKPEPTTHDKSQGQSDAGAPPELALLLPHAAEPVRGVPESAIVQLAVPATSATDSARKAPENTSNASIAMPQAAVVQQTPVINAAKLIQSIGQSEMRVGMRSAEFGAISIHTLATRDELSAQISLDHADLAKAITAHLPEMQARLGANQTMDVRIHDSGQNGAMTGGSEESGSGARGNQQQEGRSTHYAKNDAVEVMQIAGSDGQVIDGGYAARLDIRA